VRDVDILHWLALAWPYLASGAGAVVGMAFTADLTRRGRLTSFAVGLFTGWFCGPPIAELWFSRYDSNSTVPAFVNFVVGAGALTVIPAFLRRARGWAERYDLVKGLPTPGDTEKAP